MSLAPRIFRSLVFVVLVASGALSAGVRALPPQKKPQVPAPDFTKGGERPEGWTHDWNLGPTGLRGWIHSDKHTTTDARQILVTEVAEGSPAASVLKVGDVILGIGRKDFDEDPRRRFGQAVSEAEAGQGQLRLRIWRGGRRKRVALKLKALGDYAATAPYACTKSKRIMKRSAHRLAQRMKAKPKVGHVISRALNGLGLLASGEKEHLPVVRQQVEILSEFNQQRGVRTWSYAYVNLLLAEYVLATGDRRYVKRGLERITEKIVRGQSAVGSWGHDFIRGEPLRLGGYGMMNAPGIPMTISLVLAREAGVEVEGLDEAIEKSARLLRFYVGKGSVPYGDHRPWIQTHCDNGKNEMAAVLFDLLGDEEAVRYFSHMGVASHGAERDTGHTGNFFNLTWALLGVSRAGPQATGVWLEEFGWYYDLARRFDGSFGYQGAPTKKPEVYAKWDCSGAYLLAYALPLKKIFLTGRRESCAPPVDRETASSLVDDGRGWTNKDRTRFQESLKLQELLARLRSWSPVVRERAAMELGRRKKAEVIPHLKELLRAQDLYSRYGACRALKFQRGRGAPLIPALRETLGAEDLWLRILAAEALAGIGKPARVAVPQLLTLLTKKPDASDPRDMERRYLIFALFDRREGLIGKSLEGVDRQLLLEAVRHSLRNEDGRARGAVSSVYKNLDFDQLRPLLPAIMEAIATPSPSGIMFADQIRTAGLRLLGRHHVEEGMALIVDYLRNQKKHGSEKRLGPLLKLLESYGAHAQRVLPALEELAAYFDGGEAFYPPRLSKKKAQQVRETIRKIESARKKPKLISIS